VRPAPTPVATPTPTAPPSAVLLPEELDRDLQGVMTIVNDQSFATAFLIDPQGVVRKVWLDVEVAKHSADVLAALDEFEKK